MKTLLILEEHLSVVGVDELFSFVGSPPTVLQFGIEFF